jgi:hypothetical protein
MPQVRALASVALERRARAAEPEGEAVTSPALSAVAHERLLAQDIRRFLARPAPALSAPERPVIPPGPPIGEPGPDYLGLLEPYCSRSER